MSFEKNSFERKLELEVMPYQDYLQTPEWKEIREKVLKRAKYHCQICNTKKSLQIHHRTYDNRGNEDLSDLIAMCKNCHHIFHSRNTDWEQQSLDEKLAELLRY